MGLAVTFATDIYLLLESETGEGAQRVPVVWGPVNRFVRSTRLPNILTEYDPRMQFPGDVSRFCQRRQRNGRWPSVYSVV